MDQRVPMVPDRVVDPADPGVEGMRWWIVVGSACVVLGGLVAAVTAPLGLDDGSWLAAYLVLVCGVGTRAVGSMQLRSAGAPMPPIWGRTQLACWALGNLAVVGGVLSAIPLLVDVAVPLLVVALGIALVDALAHARTTDRWPARDRVAGLPARVSMTWLFGWVYRCLLIVLMVSAPIGAVLAHLSPTG